MYDEPKNANELTLEEARWAMRRLQLAMYFGDEHDEDNDQWEAGKEVNGGDLVDLLDTIMTTLGLVPFEKETENYQ